VATRGFSAAVLAITCSTHGILDRARAHRGAAHRAARPNAGVQNAFAIYLRLRRNPQLLRRTLAPFQQFLSRLLSRAAVLSSSQRQKHKQGIDHRQLSDPRSQRRLENI